MKGDVNVKERWQIGRRRRRGIDPWELGAIGLGQHRYLPDKRTAHTIMIIRVMVWWHGHGATVRDKDWSWGSFSLIIIGNASTGAGHPEEQSQHINVQYGKCFPTWAPKTGAARVVVGGKTGIHCRVSRD